MIVVHPELVCQRLPADGALVTEVLDEVRTTLLAFASVPAMVHTTKRALYGCEIRFVSVGECARRFTRVDATPSTCAVMIRPPMELCRTALCARRGAGFLVDVRQNVLRTTADMTLCRTSTARPFLPNTFPLTFAFVNANRSADGAGRCLLYFINVRELMRQT